ncbi:uncharacterized protein LOC131655760 [Vicia villosa]|uniref:uncharacterized protein LOC131655760 n=1 Tax=Vicia villosa TaxID=3911 RepID=UPI00273C9E64|nr:uncharacterized protein LOC131655760 [Vicia villosa]
MTLLLPQSLFFTAPTIAPVTYFQTPIRLQTFGSFTIRCTNQFHLQLRQPECDIQKRVVSSDLNFDSILSAVELSCLVSSAIFSAALTVNGSKNWLMMVSGNRVNAVWGVLILVGGVAAGVLLRRRQWKSMEGGLMERVEKLEDDLRKTVRVIRILSRHVEKLGKRLWVPKEPITQSADLAQKNSEATRAIAVKYEILEKEIHEIQKVLLALQEQQQKQFDLILSLKPWESKRKTPKEEDILQTTNSAEDEVIKHVEDHQI